MQEHEQNCKYRPVDCPNKAKGCLTKIPSLEVQHHLTEECQFREIKCQYCAQETAQDLLQVTSSSSSPSPRPPLILHTVLCYYLQDHYDECLKYPLECDLCDRTVDRDQVRIEDLIIYSYLE